MDQPATTPELPWWRTVDGRAWRALIASGAGWMLDAMDVTIYFFALEQIKKDFGLTQAAAGSLASAVLLASAMGGVLFGVLADRFGRVRMLMISILVYSVATAMCATATNYYQLLFWRLLVGIGFGGEWSAGALLVAESWPAKHRGKAIGLMQSGWAIGYILAAILATFITNWRVLFVVGILPAFFLLWIRRSIQEPPSASGPRPPFRESLAVLGRPPHFRHAVVATVTAASLFFAYWGLFTWIPNFLAKPVDQGGAGLGGVKTLAWIIPMQVGAFFGYTTFGFLADRFGRRPTFLVFVLAAAALVPIYALSGKYPAALMVLGPLIGFFGHGYFSVFGSMLAELFPSSVRGTAQGLCYNLGRAFSALAPITIGAIADRYTLGAGLAALSLFFAAAAAFMLLLPETKGRDLR